MSKPIEAQVWEPIKIEVTDHLTGEILTIEAQGPDSAKDGFLRLSASATAIKKAKEALAGYLDQWLGSDEEYKFTDGKILNRQQRAIKVWTIEALKEAGLDEDQISVVQTVDMSVARGMVIELQERGEIPPDSFKKLNEAADHKVSKSFVVVR